MSTDHTPGQLRAHGHKILSDTMPLQVWGPNSEYIGPYIVGQLGLYSHPEAEVSAANARRFVACWNACEGVEIELLESNPSPFSELRAERDRLHTANVELVQELKNIAEANPLNWDAPLNDTASFRAWAQSRAQAAVAKHGVTS